jgi:hypothetical protein
MASKKKDTLQSQVIEEALLPTDGQVRCPRKDGPNPVWLPSCSGCEHNKGLGVFALRRCAHSGAREVERAWLEAKHQQAQARQLQPTLL